MKYNKCYLFAFLFTIITCYMLQATCVLDSEDNKDEKILIIPCLPIENQLSANLAPELSASQVSSEKLSDLTHSSFSVNNTHPINLNNLPNELLPTILKYAGVVEPRGVNKLFYYYVTGEFVEEGIKAKGMSEGTHCRGISGEKIYSYNFKDSNLYFKNEAGDDLIKLLPIEQIPTWFWQRWIKGVENIPVKQIDHLKNTNIYSFSYEPRNWINILILLKSTKPTNSSYSDDNFSNLLTALKNTNIVILNIYDREIHKYPFLVNQTFKHENIQIFVFAYDNWGLGSYNMYK